MGMAHHACMTFTSGFFKSLTEAEVDEIRHWAQTPFDGAGITWLKFQSRIYWTRLARVTMEDVELVEYNSEIPFAHVVALYNSVNWSNYTKNPEQLEAAIENSSYVLCAIFEKRIVGLVRCISDDQTICYVQDLLVNPKGQRRGIGTALLSAVLNRYSHVRQLVLMTDNNQSSTEFYKSLGFREISGDLTGFVRLNND
ncbi:MAG: hypothetical protein RL441_1623 [Actinomycetota bacterium]